MDFACGSGSLLLNVRKMGPRLAASARSYGQEKNITTYNLARMNMLLHGVKDTEFEIFHGDTLTNDWDILRELNPAKKPSFDAIVANPPFSYRWEPTDALSDDVRFKNHGLAPKSAADFAFLLHGFHYLKDEGVMAIILPHGVLFRGGAEERIRTKLLKDGHIDTVIGLPANLFYSTGIPVCILVLKKCKKPDDVLFINAAEHFEKGKRQNQLTGENIAKIIKTYQFREEEARYSRKVEMAEIEKNDFNLNISRYISTAVGEAEIVLDDTHQELMEIEKAIAAAKDKHNAFTLTGPRNPRLQPSRISAITSQRTCSPGGPRKLQPADQPLTASLRRSTSRLLTQLKQLPSLASKVSCKPQQVVQLSRPVTAAPIDLFAVADPQESFELREGVFETIRRVLGVVFGSYRRARPGYSLGSHFCAVL
jgi:hypothetical protein